jgi:aminoglycoside phosphotransferase
MDSDTPNRPPTPPVRSQPISAAPLRKALTLCAVKILQGVRPRSGYVLFLTKSIYVKYGKWIKVSEAASMAFVRNNTSLPVSEVYCAFQHKGRTYIVMRRIKGDMLGRGWLDRTEESKARILGQLKKMIQEIRSLKTPHGSAVANVDGGSLFDERLPDLAVISPVPTSERFGPFEDIRAFHRWLRRPHEKFDERFPPEVNDLITKQESTDWGTLVFTHGDLSSLNILVRGDDVVGIVDWETSGWYPYYWEYTTASQVNPRNLFWAEHIDSFLEPFPEELIIDRVRLQYFGI